MFRSPAEKTALIDNRFVEYEALQALYREYYPVMQAIREGQAAKTGEKVVKVLNAFFKGLSGISANKKDLSEEQQDFLTSFVNHVNSFAEKALMTITLAGNRNLTTFFLGEINKIKEALFPAPRAYQYGL